MFHGCRSLVQARRDGDSFQFFAPRLENVPHRGHPAAGLGGTHGGDGFVEPTWHDLGAHIGDAGRQQPVDVWREVSLELAVLRENLHQRLDEVELAQPISERGSAVGQQDPASSGVGREGWQDSLRRDIGQQRVELHLERRRRAGRLQPQRPVTGRRPEHGAPPLQVRLRDVAGPLDPRCGQLFVEPGHRERPPLRRGPGLDSGHWFVRSPSGTPSSWTWVQIGRQPSTSR
jgi:hypothetical protein